MKKSLQTLQYLFKDFAGLTVIGFLSILGCVAITDLVFHLTDRNNTIHQVVSLTVPFEFIAGIFAFLTGLLLFITNFKVGLANGISRKTFLLANLPAAAMVAVAFSIFNLVVVLVHGLFWPINFIGDLIYPNIGGIGLLILQFTLYFLLIVIGWFVTLVYYRSTVPVKWVISLAPLMLLILYAETNIRSGGATYGVIVNYLRLSMGNSYRATVTFLAYSVILCGPVYLLIRRAPLKDL